jgi:hypothetical protein
MLVSCLLTLATAAWSTSASSSSQQQIPLHDVSSHQHHAALAPPHSNNNNTNSSISTALFAELEELARIVDISYCVGAVGIGIQNPFECPSRCAEFPSFELVTVSRLSLLICPTHTC